MGSFANSSMYRRGGVGRPVSSRWHDLPPHNYAIQLIDSPSQHSGQTALLPASSEERIMPLDVSSRFGRRLRELRQQRNLTQSEMARKFGIDRSFISDVERGRKSISLPMLEVIALGMNLTLAKLFEDLS